MDNYFGGASQFAGGGFMPSPAQGHDNQYGAGDNKYKRGAGGDKMATIRAVTVHQLLKHVQYMSQDDSNFTLDGAPLTNVTLVGKIVDVQESATKMTYKVHDGTGCGDVIMHIQDDDDMAQARKRELTLHTYVRVHGVLRVWQDQPSVTAISIRPLQDFNEVSYHNLQVVFHHLHITRGAPPAAGPGPAATQAAGGMMGYGAAPGGYGGSGGAYGAAAAGGGMAGPVGSGGAQRTGDVNMDVMQVFNNPANRSFKHGLSYTDVEAQLRSQGAPYTTQQIKDAITVACNEGLLYTTIDNDHYKSATVD